MASNLREKYSCHVVVEIRTNAYSISIEPIVNEFSIYVAISIGGICWHNCSSWQECQDKYLELMRS